MSVNLPIDSISINYVCDEDGSTWSQPGRDITEVGTMVCPECEEDMRIVDVSVTGERYPERTLDKGDWDEWTGEALSPAPGRVVIVAEVDAVSFGTRIACFKPVGATFGTSLLEFPRKFDKIAVVR